MCGICGITKNDEGALRVLQDTIVHRGPDGEGVFLSDGIGLGHRRLSIIDLSDNATQPMTSADDRYVIVFNGEIYNYRELREEIGGDYVFTSASDTEVLLAAYVRWGTDMLPKLRGIFAFAIWDNKNKELLLCRDHMGVKPLYYRVENGVLSFSSELHSFAQTNHKLQQQRLSLYLSMNYVPAGESLLAEVLKLHAGHYLIYKDGEAHLTEYYNVFCGDHKPVSNKNLYQAIDEAVKRQLVSDRPLGVFLSGGIDSSVVLHHTAAHVTTVKTYSVSYEMVEGEEREAEKFNADSLLAERTAAQYGTSHTTFRISINDIRNNLETAIASLDEPVANPTAIAQWLLSKWVREDGTVVALGGDGGDELFGGYTRHRAMMASYYYHLIPSLVRDGLSTVHPICKKLNQAPGLPLHVALMVNKETVIDQITKCRLNGRLLAEKELATYYGQVPIGVHPLDQFMRVDRRTWLAEESLARSDRSSMAHGLELRVPLLDIDVVKLSDSISPFAKTTPWTGKKILRDTYRGRLPEYIYKQPKRGWVSPGAKWFRDPVINAFCREVFSSQYFSGLDAIIDWNEVEKILDSHTSKKGYYLYPLWNILVLQIWCKRYKINV